MSIPSLNLLLAALILAAFQAVAAIPWVSAFDERPFRRWITNSTVLGYVLGGTVGLAVALAFYMRSIGDVAELERYGRYYAAVFHLQLIFDFIVFTPRALLAVWPKGGAVAVAAFRES